jgi:hypothetical protein
MSIYEFPQGLVQVAHFSLPNVQTWGKPGDQAYKESVRQAAGIAPDTRTGYEWYTFSIRCMVNFSRSKVKKNIPNVVNVPRLVVDAFIGVLYPDDNIHHVRGVQVEAVFGPQEIAEVWIFGKPKAKL